MSSRMDKYGFETPELASRSDKNAKLYQNDEIDSYSKIDLNSNVSVLKTDGNDIDVNKIKEILDKKYRDNFPKRRSIDIQMDEEDVPEVKPDTKEYDINEVLAKARNDQDLDYERERLRKVRNTNYDILDKLSLTDDDSEHNNNTSEESELLNLINTITELESRNKKVKDNSDDLLDLKDEKEELDVSEPPMENSFYTGNLSVKEEDYDDFKEIQKDIQSNSILIDIIVFIFVIVIIGIIIFFLNKYLGWGLF